jgi:hypothetical protein
MLHEEENRIIYSVVYLAYDTRTYTRDNSSGLILLTNTIEDGTLQVLSLLIGGSHDQRWVLRQIVPKLMLDFVTRFKPQFNPSLEEHEPFASAELRVEK